MLPNLPRKQVQLSSFLLFVIGAFIIVAGGWQNEAARSIGITLMAGSIWFMMMSESVLLGKVQEEMRRSLDVLSKKREIEVQELLYFLRQSKISANPLESWDGAKKFIEVIQFPAMVITSNHQIVKANEKMSNLLGWEKNRLDGTPAHVINHPVIMSKIGELCAKEPHVSKKAMHTRYIYMHKSGKKISGIMDASLMVDGGFFVVFHPDSENVINSDLMQKLLK